MSSKKSAIHFKPIKPTTDKLEGGHSSSMESSSNIEAKLQQWRDGGETAVPSIISSNLAIEGRIRSTGDLQMDGYVEGNIHVKRLVVGKGAEVNGHVFAEEAVVYGQVAGDINANKVDLREGCHVEGKILHQTILIELGAQFAGDCRRAHSPMSIPELLKSVPELPNGKGGRPKRSAGP